jgi:hypothetical protein
VKRISVYLKLRVIGAIDSMPGNSIRSRIKKVSELTFHDEDGVPHVFTWRTIQTWYYRYKNTGITGMTNHARADKGATRKVTPEEVLEAINTALPHFLGKSFNKTALYRFCIEKGLLKADQIARTTFSRFIEEYEMLKEDVSDRNKRRLAFSMQYANQLWQADTMFGPYVERRQVKLIAFIDDASRVLCHGEFFFEENADSMVKAIRAAFYKRGVPEQLLVDNRGHRNLGLIFFSKIHYESDAIWITLKRRY